MFFLMVRSLMNVRPISTVLYNEAQESGFNIPSLKVISGLLRKNALKNSKYTFQAIRPYAILVFQLFSFVTYKTTTTTVFSHKSNFILFNAEGEKPSRFTYQHYNQHARTIVIFFRQHDVNECDRSFFFRICAHRMNQLCVHCINNVGTSKTCSL